MKLNRYGGHGYDAKGDVFDSAAVVLYILLEAIRGAYRRQSDFCASVAGQLWGKRVVDMGCGFGTTTVAIAQHNPREILAVDNSELMVHIFAELLIKGQIDTLLANLNPEGVAGKNSATRVLKLLSKMCEEFRSSAFRQQGGTIEIIRTSCLDLDHSIIHPVDVVIGNNFVHWPINELRKRLEGQGKDPEVTHHEAVVTVLRNLGLLLKRGGKISLLEPKNFVIIDSDPKLDQMITERSAVLAHPAYVWADELTNELLARDYGIKREPARSAPLFKTSEVPCFFAEAGFRSVQIHLRESAGDVHSPQEMIEAVFASTPMHMAGVELPMREKIKIAKRIRRMAKQKLPPAAFHQPMREVAFVFSAEKI